MELVWLGKLMWLLAAYVLGLVGGVFLHELGHALAALLVTRQPVELQIGRDERRAPVVVGRLSMRCNWRGLRYGCVRYDRDAESRARQTVVAVSGPLASLLFSAVFFASLSISEAGSWGWFGFLGLFVANLRILVTSMWPVPHRPDGPEGEFWLSDALDVWRMWRGR